MESTIKKKKLETTKISKNKFTIGQSVIVVRFRDTHYVSIYVASRRPINADVAIKVRLALLILELFIEGLLRVAFYYWFGLNSEYYGTGNAESRKFVLLFEIRPQAT